MLYIHRNEKCISEVCVRVYVYFNKKKLFMVRRILKHTTYNVSTHPNVFWYAIAVFSFSLFLSTPRMCVCVYVCNCTFVWRREDRLLFMHVTFHMYESYVEKRIYKVFGWNIFNGLVCIRGYAQHCRIIKFPFRCWCIEKLCRLINASCGSVCVVCVCVCSSGKASNEACMCLAYVCVKHIFHRAMHPSKKKKRSCNHVNERIEVETFLCNATNEKTIKSNHCALRFSHKKFMVRALPL